MQDSVKWDKETANDMMWPVIEQWCMTDGRVMVLMNGRILRPFFEAFIYNAYYCYDDALQICVCFARTSPTWLANVMGWNTNGEWEESSLGKYKAIQGEPVLENNLCNPHSPAYMRNLRALAQWTRTNNNICSQIYILFYLFIDRCVNLHYRWCQHAS